MTTLDARRPINSALVEQGAASSDRPSSEQIDRLLTTIEAAQHLRLSARTLERFRVSGIGPRFLKAGPGKRARVLYMQADLDRWLVSYRYSSTSEYCRPGQE